MGVERVLQAAARRLVTAGIAVGIGSITIGSAHAAPKLRERVAIIDLGPADDGAIRQRLASAAIAGGLAVVGGDGVDEALAGQATDKDELQLAAAIAEAQRGFGALDCKIASTSATSAIGIAAARQAAGLPVPELARAWTYVLLCADRTGEPDAAMRAAAYLRVLGGGDEVPPDVWAKYPAVDTLLDHDLLPLEITSEIAGAEVWIDFQRRGVTPLRTFVPAGEHVIAVASGTRRGWAAGKAVKTQTTLAIPLTDQASANRALALRVAGWHGQVPDPTELGIVLDEVKARVALIRHGAIVEAWGRIGRSEPPRRLGGEDGVGTPSDGDRLTGLIVDRIQTWNDRAPDPDQPLLVEDPTARGARKGKGKADEPTRWWVYGALLGAAAVGLGVMYANDHADSTQRVELHWP